jgi:large subunit ribosomal protein L9
MELILKQDVDNLGFKDDIVSVKNGYGRNFLIPQGLADLATPSAKKVLAEVLRQRAHKEAKAVEDAKANAATLQGLELKITVKVGKGNKMFGSLNNANLADEIKAACGVEVDRKFILISGGAIKTAGKATAKIRLHREVVIDFDFEVVGKQED